MKDLKEEMAKMFVGIGQNLAQTIGGKAFEFWKRKDFRLYVEFDNLSQTEQDRIFNELEVSLIGLFTLHLDEALVAVDIPFSAVLRILQKEISTGFVDFLNSTGIEKKFLTIWEDLIRMRLKEYRQDVKLAQKESLKMKEFGKEDNELRNAWARIETITIDCLSHIRRGKVEENDPLWKLLRKWFLVVDAEIMQPIVDLAAKA